MNYFSSIQKSQIESGIFFLIGVFFTTAGIWGLTKGMLIFLCFLFAGLLLFLLSILSSPKFQYGKIPLPHTILSKLKNSKKQLPNEENGTAIQSDENDIPKTFYLYWKQQNRLDKKTGKPKNIFKRLLPAAITLLISAILVVMVIIGGNLLFPSTSTDIPMDGEFSVDGEISMNGSTSVYGGVGGGVIAVGAVIID